MLSHQIKNVFDLLRTKKKLDIKICSINTNIFKQCLSIQKVNQYSFKIRIIKINSKMALFRRNCVICITLLNTMIKLLGNTWTNYGQITLIQNPVMIQVTLFPKYHQTMSPYKNLLITLYTRILLEVQSH